MRIDSCRCNPVKDLSAFVARLRTTGAYAEVADIQSAAANA
jgi:hypothetical protein